MRQCCDLCASVRCVVSGVWCVVRVAFVLCGLCVVCGLWCECVCVCMSCVVRGVWCVVYGAWCVVCGV